MWVSWCALSVAWNEKLCRFPATSGEMMFGLFLLVWAQTLRYTEASNFKRCERRESRLCTTLVVELKNGEVCWSWSRVRQRARMVLTILVCADHAVNLPKHKTLMKQREGASLGPRYGERGA
ncbi:hypothetical protein BKA62DRAFT_712079 [Auriculariales sp. MPI-PUGE-AT-0066]|nr:hypothetical protein BKA62DRAFT_712079 [Auriculariales sp. MPI-PUGE-AT-0066]